MQQRNFLLILKHSHWGYIQFRWEIGVQEGPTRNILLESISWEVISRTGQPTHPEVLYNIPWDIYSSQGVLGFSSHMLELLIKSVSVHQWGRLFFIPKNRICVYCKCVMQQTICIYTICSSTTYGPTRFCVYVCVYFVMIASLIFW